MPFCSNCGKEISKDTKFYPECGRQLTIGQDVTEKATYSKALRWVSGFFGLFSILGAITGLEYFAESGLGSELIVDIVSIVIGTILLLMAIVPHWVSCTFKCKLEKGSVFGGLLAVLVIVFFVVVALGPEPPGGWWGY